PSTSSRAAKVTRTAASMNPTLARWWRSAQLMKGDLQNLIIARQVFFELQDVINGNPALHQHNYLWRYMRETHVSHVIMGLRRHSKVERERGKNATVSLADLLQSIIDSPERMTREAHVSLYEGEMADLGHDTFDAFCDSKGERTISAAMVSE